MTVKNIVAFLEKPIDIMLFRCYNDFIKKFTKGGYKMNNTTSYTSEVALS